MKFLKKLLIYSYVIISVQYEDDYLKHMGELHDKLNKIKTEIEKMPKSKLSKYG